MLLLLLACADPDVVQPEWRTDDVPCVEGEALWEVPDDLLLIMAKQSTATGERWDYGGMVVDGMMSFSCTSDVDIAYAVAP